jgi:hypothetical protein
MHGPKNVKFDTSFLYVGIHALVPWWNKFLNVSSNWHRSDVYHLLHKCPVYIEVQIRFLALPNFFNFLTNSFYIIIPVTYAKTYSKQS